MKGKLKIKDEAICNCINRHKAAHNSIEVINMAKAGMRRPNPEEPHGTESNKKNKFPKNEVEPVPEIQGKAKSGHKKAGRI